MSNYQEFTEVLENLKKDFQAQNPTDILQFCANYFHKRLEDQRTLLWNQQDKAKAAGLKLFPSIDEVQAHEGRSSVVFFRSPFGDNDPHSKHQHAASHDTEDPNPLFSTQSKQPVRSGSSNTAAAGALFKGFGEKKTTTASPLDPGDPVSNKASKSSPFTKNYTPGAGFAASLAKTAPLAINAHRRTSVSAEALNPDTFSNDNWKPPVHDLTQEQLERLNASVAKNFLFSQLDEESLRTIIYALEEKRVSKGTEIITQGDEGDYFYVVEKGIIDFYVNGNKVNTSGPGSSFGELALMYNSPRAATAAAETDCIVWALDRMTFRRILLEGTSKKRSMYENFLKEVPVLKSLSSYERSKLADALNTETYVAGEHVVKEGDAAENFYFIESGTAEVTKGGEPGALSELKRGDYFGELALLYDSPRQATVTATAPLKVVTLGKSGFQRLLGPAVEVLKLQDPTKH